jgi:hypothetical protein
MWLRHDAQNNSRREIVPQGVERSGSKAYQGRSASMTIRGFVDEHITHTLNAVRQLPHIVSVLIWIKE